MLVYMYTQVYTYIIYMYRPDMFTHIHKYMYIRIYLQTYFSGQVQAKAAAKCAGRGTVRPGYVRLGL